MKLFLLIINFNVLFIKIGFLKHELLVVFLKLFLDIFQKYVLLFSVSFEDENQKIYLVHIFELKNMILRIKNCKSTIIK